MLYGNLAALVPLSILQYAMIVSAQTTVSAAPSPTGTWIQSPSCVVASTFGPYGAASGIAGDPNVFQLSTGVIPGGQNDGEPSYSVNVTKPFGEAVTQYLTSEQWEYGMEVSFTPDISDNGAGTVNYAYASWAGSATLGLEQYDYGTPPPQYETANVAFPCWIHGS